MNDQQRFLEGSELEGALAYEGWRGIGVGEGNRVEKYNKISVGWEAREAHEALRDEAREDSFAQ